MHKQLRKITETVGWIEACMAHYGRVVREAARRKRGARGGSGGLGGLGGPDKIYGHFPFKTILRAQLGFMSRRRCSDSIYSSIFHTITHIRIRSDG